MSLGGGGRLREVKFGGISSIHTFTGGWLGGVDELTIKLTSASTRVGVEVGPSLAIRNYGFLPRLLELE